MHLIWKTMFSEKKIFKSYLSSTSIWVSIAEGTIRHSITSSLLLSVKILSILYLFTVREHNSCVYLETSLFSERFVKRAFSDQNKIFLAYLETGRALINFIILSRSSQKEILFT